MNEIKVGEFKFGFGRVLLEEMVRHGLSILVFYAVAFASLEVWKASGMSGPTDGDIFILTVYGWVLLFMILFVPLQATVRRCYQWLKIGPSGLHLYSKARVRVPLFNIDTKIEPKRITSCYWSKRGHGSIRINPLFSITLSSRLGKEREDVEQALRGMNPDIKISERKIGPVLAIRLIVFGSLLLIQLGVLFLSHGEGRLALIATIFCVLPTIVFSDRVVSINHGSIWR